MSEIQNLNEPWDGLHNGDEIEAFLKKQLQEAANKPNGVRVNGEIVNQDSDKYIPLNVPALADDPGDDNTKAMSQKATTDLVASVANKVESLFDESQVPLSWTVKKKLAISNNVLTSGSQSGTSITSISISEYERVVFTIYKKALSAGSGSTYLWAITDANNNVLECSDTIAVKSGVQALQTVEKAVPQGASKLHMLTSTNDESKITFTGVSFEPPKVVKNTIDYVNDKKDAIDILGAMLSEETITPTFSPNSGSSGKVIGLASNKYSIQSNNIANSVATVDVEGVLKVSFYSSIIGGGSFTKTRWLFNDADGNNIIYGETKSGASALGIQKVTMDVPKGATRLIISLQNTHIETYGTVEIIKLGIPESTLPNNRNYDVENSAVKAFRNIKYNNNDYSFSWVGRLKAMNANYDLPAPIVIDTPVDAEAQSRTLLIADNASFVKAWEIELDLISTTRNVYNLEPQKWYWWKVCKNGDVSDIINQGKFFCEGQIRELRIGASYTEAQVYHSAIQNARDIGGWQADGGRIRYGVLFRGHELDTDGTEIITAEGKAELLRLGVGVELDLRGSSAKTSPIDSSVDCVRISADLWFHHLSIYQSQMSQVPLFVSAIRAIIKAAKANKAVYAHCQGGCDRTGALCWAIEGLCGVSENDLTHDFELSDRPRSDEFMSRQNGDARDSDYKFAMDYVKGLVRYNNHIYTKSRCYDDTFITIGGVDYKRSTYEVVEGVKYFRWLDNVNDVIYCTTDVYPTTYSKVYDENYAETSSVITKVTDKFWYDCQSSTHGLSASRITDASLIASLDLTPKPNTLKEKFALLMQINESSALKNEEIEELRNIFVS